MKYTIPVSLEELNDIRKLYKDDKYVQRLADEIMRLRDKIEEIHIAVEYALKTDL